MVNIRGEDDFIANDSKKQVAADGPGVVRWYVANTANIKPGMPVKIVAGTSTGVTETTAADTGNKVGFGVAELDQTQIANCAATYAQYDLIPVLPFNENKGQRLRNLILLDPNAAIEKNAELGVGAAGFQVVTDVFATGTYIRTYKYRADPGAATTIIGDVI